MYFSDNPIYYPMYLSNVIMYSNGIWSTLSDLILFF